MVGYSHSWCRGQITQCNKLHKTRNSQGKERVVWRVKLTNLFQNHQVLFVPKLDACKAQAFVHHPEMLKEMLGTLAAVPK